MDVVRSDSEVLGYVGAMGDEVVCGRIEGGK